eukprot:c23286_g1_i1 orf=99-482(+)
MDRFFMDKQAFLVPYADALVDWLETPNAHIFKVDLPGMSKKDVEVHVHEDNSLVISGEYKQVEEKGPVIWHAAERSHGRFLRRFQLPDNVRVENVKAVLENGVLMVSVPKRPHARSVGKKIPVISKL